MGMERWYVALPGECDLLKRALTDPAFGERLSIPTVFEEAGKRGWPGLDEIDAQFLAAVRQMNAEHPGIATRVFCLDRAFDAVHYLLSEARQRNKFGADDWGTAAIYGTSELPGHLSDSGYSTPEEVRSIAEQIGALTVEGLRCFYDPEHMDATVYKFSADARGNWEWIRRYFDGFRAFYAKVALHHEAVLTVIT